MASRMLGLSKIHTDRMPARLPPLAVTPQMPALTVSAIVLNQKPAAHRRTFVHLSPLESCVPKKSADTITTGLVPHPPTTKKPVSDLRRRVQERRLKNIIKVCHSR